MIYQTGREELLERSRLSSDLYLYLQEYPSILPAENQSLELDNLSVTVTGQQQFQNFSEYYVQVAFGKSVRFPGFPSRALCYA